MVRFHRLALAAAAVLACTAFSANNGLAYAEEATEAAPETTAEATEATPVAEPYQPPEGSEPFEFEAEVHRMLDIVVNSLYTNKDVFLRELISNASDALDKIRFLSLTKPELLEDKKELEVKIEYDPEAKTLTIRDSGIGMTHDELVKNLGTVARSGTTKFLEGLTEGSADMGMIGQFGVGFYSTFLVADRVTVASKHPEEDTQNVWESTNGESSFHVGPDPRGNTLGRGTEITLHLKEDADEYADAYRLRELVKHYSEFITHPISLRTEKTTMVPVEEEDEGADDAEKTEEGEKKEDEDDLEVKDDEEGKEEEPKEPKMESVTTFEWEVINTDQPLWARDKDEITDDEYQEFWKLLAKDQSHTNSSKWSHFSAEGNINFRSILYLPSEIPYSLRAGNFEEVKSGLKLYVRKVLISDEFDLMPRYLSFIKGVVDSDDLPLNVNRETLQESKIIKIIKKKLVRKAIEMLRKLSEEEMPDRSAIENAETDEDGNFVDPDLEFDYEQPHPYIKWYKNFGPSLKMGCIEDEPNRGKLVKLLRFKTSKTKTEGTAASEDEYASLQDYVDRMKEWQKDIYIFAGTSQEELESSHFMEKFTEKDVEVIYLTEPVDEYMVANVREFEGKKFVSITKEGLKFGDEDEDLVKRRAKYYQKQFKPLTKWLKKLFGDSIMRVVISKRLGSAPAIVSSAEYGHSANMERIMRAQAYSHGQDEQSVRAMRILEINPRHPFIHKLLEGCPPEDEPEEDAEKFVVDDGTLDSAWMLLDMAMLSGGFPIEDNKAYSERMTRALKAQMGIESVALEPEVDPPEEEEEAPEVDMDSMDGINLDDFDLDSMAEEL